MSANAMAQDFAGLPKGNVNPAVSRSKDPLITMYLPSCVWVIFTPAAVGLIRK